MHVVNVVSSTGAHDAPMPPPGLGCDAAVPPSETPEEPEWHDAMEDIPLQHRLMTR